MYSWKLSDPYNTIIWAKKTLTVFKWVIEQKIKLDFNAFFVQSPRRKGVSGNHLMVESCCTKTWSIHAQLGHFKFGYLGIFIDERMNLLSEHLFQSISMAIQKGNTVCVMGCPKDNSSGLDGLFNFQVHEAEELWWKNIYIYT